MNPPATRLARLTRRAVITVAGSQAEDFLQKLLSNDVARATGKRALYACLLTPQGKFLFDFFILRQGETFFLDCEATRREALLQRLTLYRLRADVALTPCDWVVGALFGPSALKASGLETPDTALADGVARWLRQGWLYGDPRLAAAGVRLMTPAPVLAQQATRPGIAEVRADSYDAWRLELGLPEGGRDIIPEKSFLLESGIDDLHGIDWDKGCYVGQETTARTKHRTAINKRLLPVVFTGPPPPFDTPIKAGEQEIGVMRSSIEGRGLALVRLDPWRRAIEQGTPLSAAQTPVVVEPPIWADLPQPA